MVLGLMLVSAAVLYLHGGDNGALARGVVARVGGLSALIVPSGASVEGTRNSDSGQASRPKIRKVFERESFWYRAIPADAPLHPNSARLTEEFLRQKAAYYGTVSINTRSYASTVYVAGPDVARVPVMEWDCQKKGTSNAGLAEQWRSVPIPSHAAPADGTDAEMTIYQPSTDSLWEFWRARKVLGQWHACWGGGMKHASRNLGIWQRPYGATATGLPFIGGQITVEELRRGVIDHVIGISLVDLDKETMVSWPANRSDGHNDNNATNRIPAGLRFRLDPAVDVNALALGPAGKTIARAAQKYGFVVWDRAGAITLRADNPKAITRLRRPDPYPDLFQGRPAYAVLEGFPWTRLQFLPMHYGRPQSPNRHPSTR